MKTLEQSAGTNWCRVPILLKEPLTVMMQKARFISPQDAVPLQALDLCSLGRPVHLLPQFAHALEQVLADFLDQTLNRRYHAAFHIRHLHQGNPTQQEPRGQWYAVDDWRLAGEIDRCLLLRILDYRFGTPSAALPPETETERRLAHSLMQQLLPRLHTCIQALAPTDTPPITALPQCHFGTAPQTAWEIHVDLADGEHACGALRLYLDANGFERLLQQLSKQRRATAAPQHRPTFTEHVRIRLHAQFLEKQLRLGDVLDLKPGMVVPIGRQTRATVYVQQSPLFSADVVAQHGRLCLTEFAAEH